MLFDILILTKNVGPFFYIPRSLLYYTRWCLIWESRSWVLLTFEEDSQVHITALGIWLDFLSEENKASKLILLWCRYIKRFNDSCGHESEKYHSDRKSTHHARITRRHVAKWEIWLGILLITLYNIHVSYYHPNNCYGNDYKGTLVCTYFRST